MPDNERSPGHAQPGLPVMSASAKAVTVLAFGANGQPT